MLTTTPRFRPCVDATPSPATRRLAVGHHLGRHHHHLGGADVQSEHQVLVFLGHVWCSFSSSSAAALAAGAVDPDVSHGRSGIAITAQAQGIPVACGAGRPYSSGCWAKRFLASGGGQRSAQKRAVRCDHLVVAAAAELQRGADVECWRATLPRLDSVQAVDRTSSCRRMGRRAADLAVHARASAAALPSGPVQHRSALSSSTGHRRWLRRPRRCWFTKPVWRGRRLAHSAAARCSSSVTQPGGRARCGAPPRGAPRAPIRKASRPRCRSTLKKLPCQPRRGVGADRVQAVARDLAIELDDATDREPAALRVNHSTASRGQRQLACRQHR